MSWKRRSRHRNSKRLKIVFSGRRGEQFLLVGCLGQLAAHWESVSSPWTQKQGGDTAVCLSTVNIKNCNRHHTRRKEWMLFVGCVAGVKPALFLFLSSCEGRMFREALTLVARTQIIYQSLKSHLLWCSLQWKSWSKIRGKRPVREFTCTTTKNNQDCTVH